MDSSWMAGLPFYLSFVGFSIEPLGKQSLARLLFLLGGWSSGVVIRAT